MPGQPRFHIARVAVGEKSQHPSFLEIADDRPVGLALAPGPVIDPDDVDAGHLVVDGRAASDQAEQRVPTAAETQPPRQPLARSAAQRHGDLVDELIGASRPARKAPGNDIRQRLGKRRAGARRFRTAKPADPNPDQHAPPMRRQIPQGALVATEDPARQDAAVGTRRVRRAAVGLDLNVLTLECAVVRHKTRRNQLHEFGFDRHMAEPLLGAYHIDCSTNRESAKAARTLRQSLYSIPIHNCWRVNVDWTGLCLLELVRA